QATTTGGRSAAAGGNALRPARAFGRTGLVFFAVGIGRGRLRVAVRARAGTGTRAKAPAKESGREAEAETPTGARAQGRTRAREPRDNSLLAQRPGRLRRARETAAAGGRRSAAFADQTGERHRERPQHSHQLPAGHG